MNSKTLKQAFAAREAHKALLELKKVVDGAAEVTHEAELESFHVAASRNEDDHARRSLHDVEELLKSPKFDSVVLSVRKKLEIAATSS